MTQDFYHNSKSGTASGNKRYHHQHNKNKAQKLGDFRRESGQAPEAENGRNQGDDKKGNGIVEHGDILRRGLGLRELNCYRWAYARRKVARQVLQLNVPMGYS